MFKDLSAVAEIEEGMENFMKIISLGWGVQSFTLAAMSALGELPKVDYAIHADTIHESELTYEFAKRWTNWLEEKGVKIITVTNPTGGIWPIMQRLGQTHIPAFTKSLNKGDGQLRRSCTHRWKIVPMRRWIQAHRNGGLVEQWIGISLDEYQRMKESDVKFIIHSWPLIDLKMTRSDCIQWLNSRGLEVPPRSACTFCPFHNSTEWRRIKENASDWNEAVSVDNALRNKRPPWELYIHPSRIPLERVDFNTEQEKGQLSLWDEECTGICGV
jgi:hypothetical protein